MKVIEKVKSTAKKAKDKIVEKKDKIIKGGLIAGGVAAAAGIGAVVLNKINGDYDEYEVDELDGYEEPELEELDPREIVEDDNEENED